MLTPVMLASSTLRVSLTNLHGILKLKIHINKIIDGTKVDLNRDLAIRKEKK